MFSPTPAKTPFSSRLLLIWMVVLIPVFGISAWLIVSRLNYRDSDFFTFWLAGRLLSVAQNPYDSSLWLAGHRLYGAAWIPNSIFPYPLPLAIAALPLGVFDLKSGYFLWISLSQVFITLSIYLSVNWDSTVRFKFLFVPLLLGAFLFRPTLVALRNGQISAFLLLLLALVSFLWTRRRWWQGAVLVSLLVFKPTIGLPVAGLCILYLFVQKQYRAIGTSLLTLVLMAVAGWLIDPEWIGKFLAVGGGKFNETFGYNPSIWGLSGFICQQSRLCTVTVGSLFSIAIIAATLLLIAVRGKWCSPPLVLGLVVPVSLLITPYLWAYDQILLLVSVCLIVELLARKGYPFLMAASFPILFSLVSLFLLYLANISGHDAWSAGISFIAISLILFLVSKDPPGSIIYSRELEQIS